MAWHPTEVMSPEDVAAMHAHLKGNPPSVIITPILMGVIIDSVLLGIMSSQMLNFFSHSRKEEPRYIQLITIYACFMGVSVWILSVVCTMNLFGFNYGHWSSWNDGRWLAWYPILDAMTIVVVQGFYAERAYKIAGRAKIVLLFTLAPLAVSFIGSLGVLSLTMSRRELDRMNFNFVWMWIVGTLVADLVVTAVVLWGLTGQRSDWEGTDTIVKRLIKIACESQLPPTVIALALLIQYAVQGPTYFVVFFEMIQGKFYVVGMLYVLNARYFLRRDLNDGIISFAQRPGTYTMNPRSRIVGPATIHVQTETYVESHQINPAFVQPKIQPKLRQPSESGDTDTASNFGTSTNDENVNQSEVGLNSVYMERVHEAKKKGEFSLAAFAAMG